VLDASSMQQPVFSRASTRAAALAATALALLVAAWFLLLKPAVRSAATDAATESLANVSEMADKARQDAKEAKDLAQDNSTTPGPAASQSPVPAGAGSPVGWSCSSRQGHPDRLAGQLPRSRPPLRVADRGTGRQGGEPAYPVRHPRSAPGRHRPSSRRVWVLISGTNRVTARHRRLTADRSVADAVLGERLAGRCWQPAHPFPLAGLLADVAEVRAAVGRCLGRSAESNAMLAAASQVPRLGLDVQPERCRQTMMCRPCLPNPYRVDTFSSPTMPPAHRPRPRTPSTAASTAPDPPKCYVWTRRPDRSNGGIHRRDGLQLGLGSVDERLGASFAETRRAPGWPSSTRWTSLRMCRAIRGCWDAGSAGGTRRPVSRRPPP
jgi:hypothetical protein